MKASVALGIVGSIMWVLGGVIIGAVLVRVPYPNASSEAIDGLVLIVVGLLLNLAARRAEHQERW